MPEIATQTEEIQENPPEFKILSKDEEKSLKVSERKIYRKQLKMYKKELKRQKYNEYMRGYMQHYCLMKYKYDKNYREKEKYRSRYKYYKNKAIEKGIISVEEFENIENPEKLLSNLMINNEI